MWLIVRRERHFPLTMNRLYGVTWLPIAALADLTTNMNRHYPKILRGIDEVIPFKDGF